jgi:type IV pilus assembly protein PilF
MKLAIPVLVLSVLLAACVSNAPESSRNPEQMEKEAADYNLQLGIGYLRQGEYQLALEKLKKSAEQDPTVPETHMALGYLYEQINEPKDAESHLRRAARLAPDDPEVQNTFGVFLCKQGSAKEALKSFDKAALAPLYRTPEAAYTNAGVCARTSGMPDEADEYFRKALAKNANYDEALLQLASLNFERANYFPARAFTERFLQNHKATPEALLLGVNIERAMGNTEAAGVYAARLAREFPGSAEARQVLERRPDGY